MGTLILAALNRDCGEATKVECGVVEKGNLYIKHYFVQNSV